MPAWKATLPVDVAFTIMSTIANARKVMPPFAFCFCADRGEAPHVGRRFLGKIGLLGCTFLEQEQTLWHNFLSEGEAVHSTCSGRFLVDGEPLRRKVIRGG